MKTLYIVHGWIYDVSAWDSTLKKLGELGIEAKMLRVPGLTVPSKKAFAIKDYVDWADKQIPDGAVALGHSNGGRILLNLVAAKPEKLSGLILLDAAGVYHASTKRTTGRVASKILSPLKKIKPLRRLVHKLMGANDYARAPENMKRTLGNMIESDKALDVSGVLIRTEMIWGEKDTATPVADAEKLKAALKNSRLTVYPDWPHAAYRVDAEGLAKAIADAYGRLTR